MNLDELLDQTYRSKYMDQGSEAWENIRAGRFTSSEIWKIMKCGKRMMTDAELKARPKTGKGSKTTQVPDPSQMGKEGLTYINQKVAEVLTGKPKPSSYAYPLVYGKETEAEAVEYFEKQTGLTCIECGFTPYGDHAGGSPDRLIEIDDSVLEMKCPFASENQIDYLMLTDHWDLKANHPDHYWQVVSQMLFTGRKRGHFATFDPRMIKDHHKLTHIILEAEKLDEDFDNLIVAIGSAVKEKLSILNTLRPIEELKAEYNP